MAQKQNKTNQNLTNLFSLSFTFLLDAYDQKQCLLGSPLTREKYNIKLEISGLILLYSYCLGLLPHKKLRFSIYSIKEMHLLYNVFLYFTFAGS